LVVLTFLTGRPHGPFVAPGAGILLLFAALSWPIILASAAPGRALPALAVWCLALTAGMATRRLPESVRSSAWPGYALVLAGSGASIHGIWQRLGGLQGMAEDLAATEGGVAYRQEILDRLLDGRAFAGFTTPAALGCFLALTLAVTVCLATGSALRWRRALLWTSVPIQAGGMIAAASATATLALAAVLGAAFLLVKSRGNVKMPVRILVTVVVCLAALAAGVVALRGAEVLDLEHDNNPLKLRAGNVRIAGEIASDYPWLGTGPGGYGEAYALYRQEGDNESRHAHNLPMEMVAEFGVPGGVLLGVLFLTLFLEPLIRSARSGTSMKDWRFGASLGLAVFAIHNMADYTAYMPSLLWLMAVLRGLVCLDPEHSTKADEAAGGLSFQRSRLAGLAALLVVVTAATVSAGQGLAWNARYAAMEAHAAGHRQEALAAATLAVRFAPWDVDASQLQARLYLETGNVASAAWMVERAIALSPLKASSWSLRGVIRSLKGDGAGALADLEQAARLHPARLPLHEEAAVYRKQVEAALSAGGSSVD